MTPAQEIFLAQLVYIMGRFIPAGINLPDAVRITKIRPKPLEIKVLRPDVWWSLERLEVCNQG